MTLIGCNLDTETRSLWIKVNKIMTFQVCQATHEAIWGRSQWHLTQLLSPHKLSQIIYLLGNPFPDMFFIPGNSGTKFHITGNSRQPQPSDCHRPWCLLAVPTVYSLSKSVVFSMYNKYANSAKFLYKKECF
jgi:hypothetical protein